MSTNTRPRAKTLLTGAAGLAAALVLASCGANSDPQSQEPSTAPTGVEDSATLVIGSADFPESQIIAEIYAGALRAEGIQVETKPGIGSREIYYRALEDGSVQIIPDYSGNLLLFADTEATAQSAQEIMDALPAALEEESPDVNLAVLEPADAESKDALVVTQATAEKYDLTSLEDLAEVCGEITIAAPTTFQERAYGLPGLAEKYNCVPGGFEAINDGGGEATLQALLTDKVQAADIYTTTPSIEENSLVVLEDPKNNFIAQQVVPLVNQDAVTQEAQDILNSVSAVLTTEDLIKLNQAVSGDQKQDPKDAAEAWLKEKGLA
ncbi:MULTISPECIES: ABC transporter substrate-binding protein [Arthrobacter]|uniref:ABC transporter substrate-binding protein n=1 Tax=Arthrobacter caoxuetaonis TaxID=2886935 RepID=A0A9X1MBF9_9MICC|nr:MULTISPECIES: ABC transporter substrate-binding protein [Arthrobacter]MCC3281102.1 ABC transporter substrate-binding protein [Arthrobacter caoxuetaonis]MCC3296646.1 ABC transporter substrate-binding protein [Arthrobacter caoxuetaonis]MCC9192723.1 ABC transporter substrate-binding protein [Arthrobacter sp. zg-Y916]USQ56527.1 ABC transporter substrate-binding protein [Arthrobacter caoxuetaonis]